MEQVGLVEHGERDGGVVGVGADELVVDDGVGVLLRIGDPNQDIDLAGEAGGDLAVGQLDGIEIRQVKQDQRAGAGGELALAGAAVLDAEPVQKLLGAFRLPDCGQGRGGGWAACGGFAQVFADDGVEQRGFA